MSDSHEGLHIHKGSEREEHIHREQMMRRAKWAALIILLVLAIGAVLTLLARVSHGRELDKRTTMQGRVYVTVVNPTQAEGASAIDLPGTLQGAIESPIYARSNGYVVSWTKDIGAQVSQGELLATISAPEVDQELSQAIAAREQSASSLALAKSSAERWLALRQKDAVSQQELDERQSAYAQAQATLNAATANVKRLEELESFNRIVAPFSGVITRRNIDVGDLINAGSAGTARALFTMAKVDPLRLYVYVPQSEVPLVKEGDSVIVMQAELVGQQFKGVIARRSGAIDTGTRTRQVEVSLPNPDHKLLPGAYVTVRIPVAAPKSLVVPVNALLFRAEGARVAVVDANSNARLVPVRIGHDYGETLEIVEGISATDRIIINPADSLIDNQPVTIVAPQNNAENSGASEGLPPDNGASDKKGGKDKDKDDNKPGQNDKKST